MLSFFGGLVEHRVGSMGRAWKGRVGLVCTVIFYYLFSFHFGEGEGAVKEALGTVVSTCASG